MEREEDQWDGDEWIENGVEGVLGRVG